jgi:hypothetical protein
MKNLLLSLFALLALGACSGGGSVPNPGTVAIAPTSAPATSASPAPASSPVTVTSGGVTYTASLQWSGANRPGSSAGRSVQSATLAVQPIFITAPNSLDQSTSPFFPGDSQALATLAISPQPSPFPVVNWSVSIANLSVQALSGSSPLVAMSEQIVPGATRFSGSGTVTATVPSLSNLTTTAPIYVFDRYTLGTIFTALTIGTRDPAQFHPAYAFSNGVATPLSTMTGADLYITSRGMPAPFDDGNAFFTLHFPFGGQLLSTNFSGPCGTCGSFETYTAIQPSDLTSPSSTVTQNQISTAIGSGISGSWPTLVFQTGSGVVVKITLDAFSTAAVVSGAYAQHGFSPDGF